MIAVEVPTLRPEIGEAAAVDRLLKVTLRPEIGEAAAVDRLLKVALRLSLRDQRDLVELVQTLCPLRPLRLPPGRHRGKCHR